MKEKKNKEMKNKQRVYNNKYTRASLQCEKKTAIRRKRFKTLPHLLLIQARKLLFLEDSFIWKTRARFLHTPKNSRRILGLL